MRKISETYGITEVLHSDNGNYYHEAWWWCRAHRRPELGSWTMVSCIRVGPFMKEQEALNCGVALHGSQVLQGHGQ